MGQHSPKLGQHSPKIGHRPSACHVRKFRWHPPLSFPPPIPTGIAGVRSSTICSKVPVGRSTRAVIRIRERRKGLLPRMPCAVYEQDRSQNISSIRMSKHDIIFWNTRKQKGMRKNRKIPFHSQTNALLPSSIQHPCMVSYLWLSTSQAVQASLTKRSKSVKAIPGLDPSPHLQQVDHF